MSHFRGAVHWYWNWEFDHINDGDSGSDWIVAPDPYGPTGEHSWAYTTFVNGVGGKFFAEIYGLANYVGRTVREAAWAGDSCYFPGSPYSQLSGEGNSSWPVSNNNIYGVDDVGLDGVGAGNLVSYYQTLVPAMGACGFTGLQTMSMDGSGPYETHGVGIWIPDSVTVFAFRGDGQIVIW